MGTCGIILNPNAGRGRAKQIFHTLTQALQAVGIHYVVAETPAPHTAPHLTRQLIEENGYDPIIVVGGDGTINEVVNGIIASKQAGSGGAALAIIAGGTGNDFVKTLGNGKPASLQHTVQCIANGTQRTIDAGHIMIPNTPNGSSTEHEQPRARYFINDVGLGIYALVADESLGSTRLTGLAVYVRAVVRALARHRPIPLVLHYHEQQHTRWVLLAAIANGRYQGAAFCLTPQAQLDDGLLDVCTIDSIPSWKIIRHIPGAMRGTHTKQPQVQMGQTTHATITSDQPLIVSTDGEIIARCAHHISIQVMPQALEVVG